MLDARRPERGVVLEPRRAESLVERDEGETEGQGIEQQDRDLGAEHHAVGQPKRVAVRGWPRR